jgi:hypothetical protein
MFANDLQISIVAEILLASVHKPNLWTADGPTDACMALLRRNPWSHGEKLLFEVAWALWNGRKTPHFRDLVHVLDAPSLARIGRLMVAMAGDSAAIWEWVNRELARASHLEKSSDLLAAYQSSRDRQRAEATRG